MSEKNTPCRKSIFMITSRIIIFLFLMSLPVLGGTYYYSEDFTDDYGVGGQDEWTNEFWYGRDTLVIGLDDNNTQLIAGGELVITGACSMNCDRDGTWKGQYVWNTNRYDATPEQPFGWEVIRIWSLCDTADGSDGFGNWANDSRHQASIGVAMFRDDPLNPINKVHYTANAQVPGERTTNEWQQFDAIFQFDEHISDMGTFFENRISYYDGIETSMNSDTETAVRPDGTTADISNVTVWDYDLTGAVATITTNTNLIGFRMVHDGTFLSLYINPNPRDLRGDHPNEWLFITRKQVIWNTDFQYMIGSQQKNCMWHGPATGNGAFDDVLIRSTCDESIVYLQPAGIFVQPTAQTITLVLSNTILPFPQNAGINMVKFLKPSNMVWSNGIADLVNNLQVTTRYDAAPHLLTAAWFTPGTFPGDNEVHIMTNAGNPHEVTLILGSQVTNMATATDERIEIQMDIIQNSAFSGNYGFTVYVNAEQFEYMPGGKKDIYATCGWQKTLTGVSFSQSEFAAEADAGIFPNTMVQGENENFSYTVRSTSVPNHESIRFVAIEIPPEFTPSNISNIKSEIITNDAGRISIGSIPALSANPLIILDYSDGVIPAPGGFDSIRFSYNATSASDPAIGASLSWNSWVDGVALDGASLQTTTSTEYPDQTVTVVAAGVFSPAEGFAGIFPNSIQQGESENFIYKIRATSLSNRENIRFAAVEVPPHFDTNNIGSISSEIIADDTANIYFSNIPALGTNILIIFDYFNDFSAIPSPGGFDSIQFSYTSSGTNDPGTWAGSNAAWQCWIDGSALDGASLQADTNSAYPDQEVVIAPPSILMPAEALASITPNSVVQGNSIAFTYKIQATPLAGRENIAQVAIEIPPEFTPGNLSGFDSILLGTNEATDITIGSIPALTANPVIIIDYTALNIVSPGGLDVITFNYVSGGASDPILGSSLDWNCWVDGLVVDGSSLAADTNYNYPSQMVNVTPGGFNFWDYYIIRAVNHNPVSMGISNTVALAYFDVAADGENTLSERVVSIDVELGGNNADIAGTILVYRDFSDIDTLAIGTDTLVNSVDFANPAAVQTIALNDGNQSQDQINPTRYWVALNITNRNPTVFDDTVFMHIESITVAGPNSGVLNNSNIIDTMQSNAVRVDTHELFADITTQISDTTKQGSFNNLYFELEISNADPDATNYFTGLAVSNMGTGTTEDFGFLKLFLDDGSGTFVATNDSLKMAGAMASDRVFYMTVFPPVELSGTGTVTLWGAFDVELTGDVGDTIDLTVENGSSFSFYDPFNDHSDPRPTVRPYTAFPQPAPSFASGIIPFTSQEYDFYMKKIFYTVYPESFTTGQYVPVSRMEIFMDTEDPGSQEMTGLTVDLSGSFNNADGVLYLYQDAGTMGSFSELEDIPVGSNFVVGGSGTVNIPLSLTGLSTELDNADNFFLVYQLTNDIAAAAGDTLAFQVSGASCNGPDGGVFTNLSILSAAQSAFGRLDDYSVSIDSIINTNTSAQVVRSSFGNPMFAITLSGNDPDGTNYLSTIDINTNNLPGTDWDDSFIRSINIYSSFDGVTLSGAIGNSTFTGGAARITLSSPVVLENNTPTTIYVGFDVSETGTVVNKNIGFMITNGAFGFVDGINDGFDQTSYLSGISGGPAILTNLVIINFGVEPYDIWLQRVDRKAPAETTLGIEVPVISFDASREDEIGGTNSEWLKGVFITNLYNDVFFEGILRVYTNSPFVFDFDLGGPAIASNYISSTNPDVFVEFFETNYLTVKPDLTRFFVTFTPTSFASGATNGFRIYSNLAGGPDDGYIENSAMFAVPPAPMLLQDLNVDIMFSNRMPSIVTQGSTNILAAYIEVTADDADAVWELNSLSFQLGGTYSGKVVGSLALYLDNGTTPYMFDSGDTLVEGSGGAFVAGDMVSTFNTPLMIDSTGVSLLAVIEVDGNASTEASFTVDFTVSNQDGFSPLNIEPQNATGTTVDLIVNAAAYASTTAPEIHPSTTARIDTLANNIIYTDDIEDDPSAAAAKIRNQDGEISKAAVYDMVGRLIKELDLGTWVYWDGTDSSDTDFVPSGLYFIRLIDGEDKETIHKIVVMNRKE